MVVDRLPSGVREFAGYLDGLLARLDQDDGWSGVFWRRDPDGMRACLDGREVLPWDVVEALLEDLATTYGTAAAGAERERARALYRSALTAYDALPGARDTLLDRLDVMLREQRYAAERQAELTRLLSTPSTTEDTGSLRLGLAWARDDHERATARCAELRDRLAELDRRAPVRERGVRHLGGASGPLWAGGEADGSPVERRLPEAGRDGRMVGEAWWGDRGASGVRQGGEPGPPWRDGEDVAAPPSPPPPADGSARAPHAEGSTRAPYIAASAPVPHPVPPAPAAASPSGAGRAPQATSPAHHTEQAAQATARSPEVTRAVHYTRPSLRAGQAAQAASPSPGAGQAAQAASPSPDAARAVHPTPPPPYPHAAPPASRAVPVETRAATAPPPSPATEPAPPVKPRKRRRGSARFAGMVEEGAAAGVVLPQAAPVVPEAPARRTPRGARFAGAGQAAEPATAPVEVVDAEAVAAVAGVVERLARLRAEGRSGEAHVLLVEVVQWPPGRFPALADALHRAGLGADWATLLWETASLPAERLVAAADALTAAGREADGRELLRQGVDRPAEQIGAAVLRLAEQGRIREAGALLDACVRVRTAEEVARSAVPDPHRLVPLLLDAAQAVSDERHWDLVHALRVAGYTT
ncbi:hypothetical protein ACFYZB_37275 [Streptomyces sp. NPDC001852]|uniref:hypothetical protein n=1 Tax=Streptomyces sp. NPDC001852 TaxID=3364619 RepID=UPI00367494D5